MSICLDGRHAKDKQSLRRQMRTGMRKTTALKAGNRNNEQ